MRKIRKYIAILLVCALTLCGCTSNVSSENSQTSDEVNYQDILEQVESAKQYQQLNDVELLTDMEETVFYELGNLLDENTYKVENVSTYYVSKEYLEELEYNSRENVYFGYTLTDLEKQFQGTKYVFTLGDDGKTVVKQFQDYDDTYEKALTKIAIGTGVILVCATVSVITAATGATAISVVLATSAKTATKMALSSGAIATIASGAITAVNGGSFDDIIKSAIIDGSDAFMWSAIGGSLIGGTDGIVSYKLSNATQSVKYFKEGTAQATRYSEGITFTNGYPRFEKYSKATVKFDSPSLQSVENGTCLTGNYSRDSRLANTIMGYSETPKGYVWHHVEDMETMILVPQDVHSVAFGGMPHTGGASLIKKYLAALLPA